VIGTLHIFWQNLEKYRQNSKSISQIKNLEGNIVSETNDILDTVHDYYEQLFSCVQNLLLDLRFAPLHLCFSYSCSSFFISKYLLVSILNPFVDLIDIS
jgi:hypothetical protein